MLEFEEYDLDREKEVDQYWKTKAHFIQILGQIKPIKILILLSVKAMYDESS